MAENGAVRRARDLTAAAGSLEAIGLLVTVLGGVGLLIVAANTKTCEVFLSMLDCSVNMPVAAGIVVGGGLYLSAQYLLFSVVAKTARSVDDLVSGRGEPPGAGG